MTNGFATLYYGGMEKADACKKAFFDCDDEGLWRLVPSSVREMAEHIGRQSAVALCMTLGGENITIPIHENANQQGAASFQRLADAIGEEDARKLCAKYGGIRLPLPTMSAARGAARSRSIERFVALRVSEGLSQRAAINEASRVFGITARSVENNINKIV